MYLHDLLKKEIFGEFNGPDYYNPEHQLYLDLERKNKRDPNTIVTKSPKDSRMFTTKPHHYDTASPGYKGREEVLKFIDRKQKEKITQRDSKPRN